MDIMVKRSGSIRDGRAVDGKLRSHLEWPYSSSQDPQKINDIVSYQESLVNTIFSLEGMYHVTS